MTTEVNENNKNKNVCTPERNAGRRARAYTKGYYQILLIKIKTGHDLNDVNMYVCLCHIYIKR